MPEGISTGRSRIARHGSRASALAVVLAAGVVAGACVSIDRDGGPTSSSLASPAQPIDSGAPATPEVTSSPTPAGPQPDAGSPSAVPGATTLRSEAPSIGYIALDERVAFVQAVSAGIRAAAALAGIELVECDSGWTREGAMACSEQLADAGVHGIIGFHPFDDVATRACELTGNAPTVGVVFDQGPCQVSRLHIDQAESGRLAGEAMGRFASERWDCAATAYVSLGSGDADPDGQARMAGYRSGYESHCPLPGQVSVLDGADRLATAQTQVARLLDDLDGERIVVVGLNEDAILGAMAAASAAGRERDLWYSGQLADPSIRGHIACDGQYVASVAQAPERFGSSLLPVLVDALEGGVVPARLEATLELVTSANVRELFPDTPACDE